MKTISVIGLGNRGTEYMGFIKGLHSGKAKIVAVCDISQQALDDISPKFGIPKDKQDRVFERFYRVDKSHSREIGGTGLGLSIVKHAAMYHGAEISLDSEEGAGTEIKVKFKG